MTKQKKLLIIGAGAEKTEGIDMPLATELVPQIRDFLYENEEGKSVDKELRKVIKGLRFSYDGFVKKAVDKLASDFRKEVNSILVDIKNTQDNETLDEDEDKIARIIVALLEKIQKLQEDVILDDETANLISEVFSEIEILDENIVDLGKLSFSDTFDVVMKKVLEISIRDPNHKVLKHVYKNLMDFESLLLKHFVGFYTESNADIKNYLYISWTLWAFLVWKEKQVFEEYKVSQLPFYSSIKTIDGVITFNYTSFAYKTFQNNKYFHGSLRKYIRLDNRGEFDIDDFDKLNIVQFIKEIVAQNILFDDKRFIIPSIVPPLKLKPVLSNEYIDMWYDSLQDIRDAEKIIVVGYSFNYADEHFNDLIRKNKDKEIIIIDPYPEVIISNLKRIFNYRKEDYTENKIQDHKSFQCDKLKVIKAYASDINIDEL